VAIAPHRQEVLLQGLLELAPDATVGIDLDGVIVLVNSQAERLLGYTRDQMLGQPLEMLIPDRFRRAHRHHPSGYLTDHQPGRMGAGMQLTARRADGSEVPVEIRLSALETEEGLIVAAAVRDVTDRLESPGQVAGGVAHDFNNLLAVISNYAAFVGEAVASAGRVPGGERWAAVASDVEQIQLAAERATRLTHQLLAITPIVEPVSEVLGT
jgi:PAS domain S-box-containing protein